MPVTQDLDLTMTRLALEIAVDQLTVPEGVAIVRDDGSPITERVPSLLEQLEEAQESNSGRGGSFAARSKPPVWIDAVSLLAEVDRVVLPHARTRPTRVARVRAWAGAMHALTDRVDLEDVTAIAESWVRRTRALLDPRPAIEIAGPCPTCGESWIDMVNEEGEPVWRRTLRASTNPPAAWCEACTDRWGSGERLHLLADHLKRQTEVEHLAVEEAQ